MADPIRYAVTAASGHLGRLAVAALARRAGADAVVAIVRDPAKAAGLFPTGVAVRQSDYDRRETLDAALEGVDKLLLISSSAVGARIPQHRNAIDAARSAGVARIAYTSLLHADSSPLKLAEEHIETEKLIATSGVPFTLLRNGWYTENYTAFIPSALQHGTFIGAARDGRISSAARADYAEAAAVALIGDEGDRVVYELAGDTAFTLNEFAAEIAHRTGKTIPYVDMSEAEYRAALIAAGLPEPVAGILADSSAATATGALFDDSGDLSRLIGRPTTPYSETIAAALKG